jgi:DNA-binding MarR family transcriptional regulator
MKKRRVDEQAETITIPPEALPYLRWMGEDLTCRQAAVLAIVTANPGVTVGAVAAVMGIPKPGVTRAADKLVDWGLMLRSVNRMDRRLVELHAKKAAPARTGQSTRRGG